VRSADANSIAPTARSKARKSEAGLATKVVWGGSGG
jgi:hypothetical protein